MDFTLRGWRIGELEFSQPLGGASRSLIKLLGCSTEHSPLPLPDPSLIANGPDFVNPSFV